MNRYDTVVPRPLLLRRLFGVPAAALALVTFVSFAAGAWNPWRLVRLQQFCSNPLWGLVLVNALVLIAFWLLFPVQSEAAQATRHTIRWALLLTLIPVLLIYGMFHRLFGVATKELAHSPSGERRAAMVTHGDDQQLHIWVGGALTMRDAGIAGFPCGPNVSARFISEDTVHISSVYGEFNVHLDPKTGNPIDPTSRSCAG